MLSGAAKTLTETETQIHPRTWTRSGPCTAKCVTKRIKAKEPTFIAENSLNVKFCNQLNIFNEQTLFISIYIIYQKWEINGNAQLINRIP